MENLIRLLNSFTNIIEGLEKILLKNHDLEKPLYENIGKIPRQGIIIYEEQVISYKIHGSGCTYEYKNGLIVDYDFISIMETTINISPWKLCRFLNSIQSDDIYTEKNLLPYLEQMVTRGILVRHPEGFYQFGILN
jgi:hypothetical protein